MRSPQTGRDCTTMQLTQAQKKQYRSIGHDLHPLVTIAGKGLTDAILAEVDRALEDHELIKIKLVVGDRDIKKQLIQQVCEQTGATLVQTIGHMALLLRRAKQPNPKLSNLLRHKS